MPGITALERRWVGVVKRERLGEGLAHGDGAVSRGAVAPVGALLIGDQRRHLLAQPVRLRAQLVQLSRLAFFWFAFAGAQRARSMAWRLCGLRWALPLAL